MNAIDKAISAISPSWGLRREAARVRLEHLRSYAAAGTGRRTSGWRADGRSMRAETEASNATLRMRARKMVQDNPYAASALDKLNDYQVGTGLMPRSATGNKARDDAANRIWAEWAPKADWFRASDVYGLQSVANRARIESGEALLRWIPLSTAEMRRRGMRIPLALHVMEPDYLDDSLSGRMIGGNLVDQGIEFDADDQRVAYWLFDRHPGDVGALYIASANAERIDARQIIHVYRDLRVGQIRGVTEFASSMLRLRMLDDLEDAALEAARVQASLAAFVTTPADPAKGPLRGTTDSESGEKRLTFRPGMIERLRPGESIAFNNPTGNAAVDAEAKRQLRAVAEGLGLTYDILTGDLTGANYSSLRAGRLVFKRRLESLQWNCLIPRMAQPMWDTVMATAQAMGYLPATDGAWPVKWSPPRFEMLDPGAEMKALKEGVRDGFVTMPQAIGELGWDPDEQLAEIAAWNAKADAAGIVLDTDPRHIAGASGSAQPPDTAVAVA